MKHLIFELTMPNVGSWNGKWTGSEGKYLIHYRIGNKDKKANELDGKSFYYNFDDGWGANVSVKKMELIECNKLMKQSDGFCGYDWMVDEILKYDKILSRKDRKIMEDKNEQI